MAKTKIFRACDVYCTQASVGALELTAGSPTLFFGASQEDILKMTKRTPLKIIEADLCSGRYHFLDDGTHRLYVIRFLSQDPSPDIRFHAKVFPNNLYRDDLLLNLIRQGRTIDTIGYRA